MAQAWTHKERGKMKDRIDHQAEMAKIKLGAKGVVMICFFADGPYLHAQDGWSGEMPAPSMKELYGRIAEMYQMMEESGGSDVVVQ